MASTLLNDLVAYWKLDETGGTRYDSTDNSYDLTDDNSVGYTAGLSALGNAAALNNSNQSGLVIASNTDLCLGTSKTFVCWFQYTAFAIPSNAYVPLFLKGYPIYSAGEYSIHALQTYDSHSGPRMVFNAQGVGVSIPTDVIPDVPNFIVAWYDSTEGTINLQLNNGQVYTAEASAQTPGSDSLQIGYAPNSSSCEWTGWMQGSGIWNRVLTSGERTALYNSGDGWQYPWGPFFSAAVSPSTAALQYSETQQFACTVAGGTLNTVTWSCLYGSITAEGLYTAPSSSCTDTITATNDDDNSVTSTATVTVWSLYDWSHYIDITVPAAELTADLTNFPLLVSVTEDELKSTANGGYAQSDGDDILFTLVDGTILDYERESCDPATGALIAWVKAPTLSHTVDNVIRCYVGNPDCADQQNAAAVWGGYSGVWHMDNTSSPLSDVVNSISASVNGNVSLEQSGKIGSATGYDGNNSYLTMSNANLALGTSDFTVETWIYCPSNATYQESIIFAGDINTSYVLLMNSSRQPVFSKTGVGDLIFGPTLTTNTWHHAVVTRASGVINLFIDGSNVGTANDSLNATSANMAIGRYIGTAGTQYSFTGNIDEFHIANTYALSAAQIAAEYANQSDPATFYTLGEWMENFPPVSAISISPTTANLYASTTQQFTSTVTGGSTGTATWSIEEAGGGSVTSGGLYTAPSTPGTYHITATSVDDGDYYATATVTVYAPIAITIDPTVANVFVGNTVQVTGTVTGGMGNTSVTYTAPDGGNVTSGGLFSAPIIPGTYRVIAASVEDSAKTATATITVAAKASDEAPSFPRSLIVPNIFPRIY